MIDVSRLKTGTKIKMKDGETGFIRGSYMSVEGIVFTVKTSASSICDRNVPLTQIEEVVE